MLVDVEVGDVVVLIVVELGALVLVGVVLIVVVVLVGAAVATAAVVVAAGASGWVSVQAALMAASAINRTGVRGVVVMAIRCGRWVGSARERCPDDRAGVGKPWRHPRADFSAW
jgi:hypothetical protein